MTGTLSSAQQIPQGLGNLGGLQQQQQQQQPSALSQQWNSAGTGQSYLGKYDWTAN
jgi:hypothetical protein